MQTDVSGSGFRHRPNDRSGLWVDQREPTFPVTTLAQMGRTLDQDDLKRRPRVTFDQMAGEGCSVPAAEHAVDVQRGRPSSPTAMSPVSDATSTCSSTRLRRYSFVSQSK